MIGMSNFEGLNNRQQDLPEYIRRRGGEGYKFIRVFTDLGWGGAGGVIRSEKNIYLYEFDSVRKQFNPNRLNMEFVKKLYDCGKAAKQSGMDGIILCLATNPEYWQKTVNRVGYGSYPWQLGFRDTIGFMQVADPNWPQWKMFDRYLRDLNEVCNAAPNPQMFRIVETYNELKRWGSIGDTHPHISKLMHEERPGLQFQFNPPLEELEEGYAEHGIDAFDWPKRLMNTGITTSYGHFRANRVSFHGFYKGNEIIKAAAFLKKGGLDIKRITIETDGATPNNIFTRAHHTKHYLWRLVWRDTPENIANTIKAHRGLIAAAKETGITLNIQDVVKWSLMEEDAALELFYKECAKEVQR